MEFDSLSLSLEELFLPWGTEISVLSNLITAYLDDLVHLVYSPDSHWSGPGGILPQTNLHFTHSIQFKRHLLCMNGQPHLTLSIKCKNTYRAAVRLSFSAPLSMLGIHCKDIKADCYPELITKESTALSHSRSFCQSTYFCWTIYAISLSKRTFCHRWFNVVAPWSTLLQHALIVFRNLGSPRQDLRGKGV